MPRTVLHVSPHPDDEVLGAGATLELLRRAGWTIHNLACTLGRPADHARREQELRECVQRAGMELTIMSPLAGLSSTDDLEAGAAEVATAVRHTIDATGATVVVSPHAYDGHHAHEAVGRGVRNAVLKRPGVVWWAWGLWADLPKPNLYVPFDHDVLDSVMYAIAAYEGENARNSYDRLYPARATAQAVLGSERVFGFGSPAASSQPYADLITETRAVGGKLDATVTPRILDPREPFTTE